MKINFVECAVGIKAFWREWNFREVLLHLPVEYDGTYNMTENIIYFLIYWVVSGFILVMIMLQGVEKPRLKDWLPTFILAPLIFPFFMAINHRNTSTGGYFGTGRKKKEKKEQKNSKPK